jgi:hypothetical protein
MQKVAFRTNTNLNEGFRELAALTERRIRDYTIEAQMSGASQREVELHIPGRRQS